MCDNFYRNVQQEALKYMSLPERLVSAIKEKSEKLLEERMTENKKTIQDKKRQLQKAEEQLHSVEEKWINNQIAHDSYYRWHSTLTSQRVQLAEEIKKLSQDQNQVYLLLEQNLGKLTDMLAVYQTANTLQKQELVKTVFDSSLYYKDKVYRTPFIMPVFTHNLLTMKEKQLLELDKNEMAGSLNPARWT